MSCAPVIPENFSLVKHKRKLSLQKNLSGTKFTSWNISHLIPTECFFWAPDKFLWALIFLFKNSEQKFSGVTVFFESPKPLIFLSAIAMGNDTSTVAGDKTAMKIIFCIIPNLFVNFY